MLEIKTYTKAEIETILNTRGKQNVTRKLDRYEVEYETCGRRNYEVIIRNIRNPFKLYCIMDMGIPAQTDFTKFRDFLYYFFCDEEFPLLPDEKKSVRMNEYGTPVSRQTISKWINRLSDRGWIGISAEFNYYFSYKGEIIHTDQETYCKAWREYWGIVHQNKSSSDGINIMIYNYGGIARKHPLPKQNAFCIDEIKYVTDLVVESVEKENQANS